jgi:hypothetical protein
MVRGSIVLNNEKDVVKALESVRLNPEIKFVRVKNEFKGHLKKGEYKSQSHSHIVTVTQSQLNRHTVTKTQSHRDREQ